MKRRVVFRRAARAEFDEAIDWYERQKPGLGTIFKDAVTQSLGRIRATPYMHQIIYENVRRGGLRKFPYSILYEVERKRVVVIGVFHDRRDPAIWKARI